MSVPYLESGSAGKYHHSVSGVPLGCAVGNSLDLLLVFSCTPLLSPRYRHNTVQVTSNSSCPLTGSVGGSTEVARSQHLLARPGEDRSRQQWWPSRRSWARQASLWMVMSAGGFNLAEMVLCAAHLLEGLKNSQLWWQYWLGGVSKTFLLLFLEITLLCLLGHPKGIVWKAVLFPLTHQPFFCMLEYFLHTLTYFTHFY